MRRRVAAGLPHADTHAAEQQLPIVRDSAGQDGHDGPQGDADGNDADTIPSLGESRHRQPERRVEQGKRHSTEQAEFEIG